ncbi:synaptogyrin-2a [Corythoichthys intestinalis]|uniref:synaptogyrin-2a n=1 Tax=Corythoichthys intestinalis TaxID=161448 RepID=UPI0025A64FC5|nr:synaptogyrin-2a [Corythoichthys intestinalis]XP_061805875.1 synaptogyrin-2-like [Nerophis lumbriciformis]
MESSAYGAPLAGGAFDLESFVKKPQTILRFLSWLFAIVVFATITAEGYINFTTGPELTCIFNGRDSACGYGMWVGVLAFLACVVLVVLDAYFPRISNAKERKYIIIGDLAFSATWTFLWFICFCVLANQWSWTTNPAVPGDAARAVVTFSFFSVLSWGLLSYFAYERYREGVSDVAQQYTDPAVDPPYSTTASAGPGGYQQSPFSQNQDNPGDYVPPSY